MTKIYSKICELDGVFDSGSSTSPGMQGGMESSEINR